MALNRRERFTNTGSKSTCDLTQCVQNVFFSCGLHLLLVQNISAAAVLCAERQHVLASKACNRAVENGGAGSSFADFPGDLRGKSCVGWLGHQLQHLLDALV